MSRADEPSGAVRLLVDTFAGGKAPLLVAEVERGGPVTDLTIPAFCVTEVTSDPRFSNDALASRPYGSWAAEFEVELATSGPRSTTSMSTDSSDRPTGRLAARVHDSMSHASHSTG